MRKIRNKKNIYPLPTRTVLYSHKKNLRPIPIVGKKYHCFDDGKITFSRHYIVEVTEVLGQMAFKRKYREAFEKYLQESKSHYWLYSRSSDKFIIARIVNDEKYDEEINVFVRTKQGGWFSIGYPNWGDGGRLDISGSLWDGLVEMIDEFDYTEEEKKKLIEEGTI